MITSVMLGRRLPSEEGRFVMMVGLAVWVVLYAGERAELSVRDVGGPSSSFTDI